MQTKPIRSVRGNGGYAMRPRSILLFEKLWLAGVALGAVNIVITYRTLREFAIARDSPPGAIFVGAVFGLLLNLLFWYLIARKASNTTKWVLVAMTTLGLIFMAVGAQGYLAYGTTYVVGLVALTLLQLLALSFLFRDDAVRWLRSRGLEGVVDTTVFD